MIRLISWVGSVVVLSSVTFGQLTSLQNKAGEFTSADRDKISGWVSGELSKLAEEVLKPITEKYKVSAKRERVKSIRERIYNGAKGTKEFRRVYFEVLGDIVSKKIQDVEIEVAIQYGVLVKEVASPVMFPCYLSLLDSKDKAIVLIGLSAIGEVANTLTAKEYAKLEEKLNSLIKNSEDEIVLAEAIGLMGRIPTATARKFLVELLVNHSSLYGKGDISFVYPDRFVVDQVERFYNKLAADEQKRVLEALRSILVSVTKMITAGSKNITFYETRVNTELLIYKVESSLAGFTGRNKDLPVISALKRKNFGQAEKSLEKWVK